MLDSTCFAVGQNVPFLVCVLNSKMGHYLLQNAPKTGTGDLLISVQAVEPLLIPTPNDEIMRTLTSMMSTEEVTNDQEIDALVFEMYRLSSDEVRYVETCISNLL